MKPFKLFFGLAIGIILFLFVARVLIFAFVVAAVMSIIYAAYRRIKDFITYDRYGEYYIPEYQYQPRLNNSWNRQSEPLFFDERPQHRAPIKNIQFIDAQ